jgi:tetratricopeptide (TPR) repeat protein
MPTPTEHHSRATSLRLAGDMMGAVENYKQVLALVPDSATTWNELGTALRSLGRFDEAVDCFRHALVLKPDLADAYRNLALGEQLSADNSELASIAALVDATDLAIEDRSTAAFALGKALDDAGRFDEAFAAYERANSMYRAARAAAGDWFDAVALSRQVDEIIAAFTPDFFAKVAGWGIRSEVPVFIVGMPRSGTSLVEQIAASHSRVSGAGELLHIGRMYGNFGPPIDGHGLRWEEAVIRRAAGGHLQRLREIGSVAERVIDKMPDNVFYLGLVATLYPQARIILCRRDPRDVALSCFFQKFMPGTLGFSYALADCGRRQVQIDRLIEHWRRVLPLPMLEVNYEKLVADLAGESQKLVSFLGLEWEPACLEFHRTERTVVTASSWQVRQPIYDRSVGRWRNYERHLEPLVRALSSADDNSDPSAVDDAERTLQSEVIAALSAAAEQYRAGDLDRAETLYREVLKKVPQHPETLHWLGVIAGIRGRHQDAVRLISRSIVISAVRPDAHFDLGYALQQLGRVAEAEAAFCNALTLRPDYPAALATLGSMLLAGGRVEEAIGYFRKLVAAEPDDAAGHFDVASCLRRLGDLQGSLDSLRLAVSLAPEFQSGWNDLGLTYLKLESWDDAEECFRRVLSIEPGSSRAVQQLFYVQQKKLARILG